MQGLEGTTTDATGGQGGAALNRTITVTFTGLGGPRYVAQNALKGLGNEALSSNKEYCKEL